MCKYRLIKPKFSISFCCNHCKRVNNKFSKSMIYHWTSCNTKKRIVQNIYIHNSNGNYKRINYNNNNINQEMDRLLELKKQCPGL